MKITDILATPTTITAAAHPTTPAAINNTTHGTANRWKQDAWDAYNTIGELRKVTQWLGNNLSLTNLYAAEINPDGTPSTTTTTHQQPAQIVADIAGGPAGQAKLLGRLATGLTIVGETWIAVISRTHPNGTTTEEWHVLSAKEIHTQGNDVVLRLEDGDHDFNEETDILTRVHRPHPENSRESDSPVRAALQPIEEIRRTSAAIQGASKSRLAGNGILALPQEMTMPVQQAPAGAGDAPGLQGQGGTVERSVTATDIMVQLQQVMTTAISDPASAAALVPIVLKAPGEHLDKIRHITFESEVTATNLEARERALARLARSLDIPPEVMTGIGGTNHWNAWAVDEDAITSHVAPLMTIICDALTEAVLRPLLEAQGLDPHRWVVWFDTTRLTQKADRSEDAVLAYDRGIISADTLRHELGFGDEDKPTEEEARQQREQAATRAARTATTPAPTGRPADR